MDTERWVRIEDTFTERGSVESKEWLRVVSKEAKHQSWPFQFQALLEAALRRKLCRGIEAVHATSEGIEISSFLEGGGKVTLCLSTSEEDALMDEVFGKEET
jgi:hypothetical protein